MTNRTRRAGLINGRMNGVYSRSPVVTPTATVDSIHSRAKAQMLREKLAKLSPFDRGLQRLEFISPAVSSVCKIIDNQGQEIHLWITRLSRVDTRVTRHLRHARILR
jgi:hypothetical protein